MKRVLIAVAAALLAICMWSPAADAIDSGTTVVPRPVKIPPKAISQLRITPIMNGKFDSLNKSLLMNSEYDQFFCFEGGTGSYRHNISGLPEGISPGLLICDQGGTSMPLDPDVDYEPPESICNIYGKECPERNVLWLAGRPQYNHNYKAGLYDVKITLEDREFDHPDAELEYQIEILSNFKYVPMRKK